jgi:hypothetical protein
LHDLGNPAAVGFALYLDLQVHGRKLNQAIGAVEQETRPNLFQLVKNF